MSEWDVPGKVGSIEIVSIGVEATFFGVSLFAYSIGLISLGQLFPTVSVLSGL